MVSSRTTYLGLFVLGVSLIAWLAIGCDGGTSYPVEGRVLLKGKPLKGKEGTVVLKPDASKGNTSSVPSAGVLQPDGSFKVQPDAQPGWYKVIITATEPGQNPNEELRRAVHPRYEKEATTPLAIEVVADPSPNSYDLPLSP